MNIKRQLVLMVGTIACATVPSCTTGSAAPTATSTQAESFSVTSPDFTDGGDLPVTFTCDGESLSPALTWSGEPAGTSEYAVLMDHQPGPDDWHWYWTEWGIAPDIHSLGAGSTGEGTFGTNSVNAELAYTPPCSKGPGPKTYVITVFALSSTPELPDPALVDRDTLLDALADITLASDSISATYTRG